MFTQLYYHHHYIILEHFNLPQRNPVPIRSHSPFSLPKALAAIDLFLSVDLLILYIRAVESYNMWSVMIGFFHLTECFQGSSMWYLCFIPSYAQMMECVGLEFKNKAGKSSDLLSLASFFPGKPVSTFGDEMGDFLSLPVPTQLLLFLNVLTPGRKVGFWKKVCSFLYWQEN